MKSSGAQWSSIGTKIGRENFIAQASSIIATDASYNKDQTEKPLTIAFLTMIGGHTYNASVDAVLAMALKARGHDVSIIACDQQLPLCETKKNSNTENWEANCAKCWNWTTRFFGAYGLPVKPVSEILQETEKDAGSWEELVDAALLKHYGVGILDPEICTDLSGRRAMYQQSAQVSATVGQWLVNRQPDRVIMSHGIYCTWGPARTILDEKGVKIVTYGKGKKRQTEKFNWQTSADWWDISKEWDIVRDQPLSNAQASVIDAYLDSRRQHSQDTLVYNFGEEETREKTLEYLGLSPNKQTHTLFTNVLWDAASAQREIAFANPIEWVFQTIDWYMANPEKQLVVKIHPAEVVIGTNQPFSSIISNKYPSLPGNIRIIEPHEKVNSWSILKITDLGLVHTSTVGIELALEGIPCVVVSRTHYRDKGFTLDINNRDEYFDLLKHFDSSKEDKQNLMELSKRYSYILFERYQLPFDFMFEPEHTIVQGFSFASIEELMQHQTISTIVESIEKETEFLLPPHE